MNDAAGWRHAPFDNDQTAAVWDAVCRTAPTIAAHISGESINPAISLSDCVHSFHAAAQSGPFVLFPGMLAALLGHFPKGGFAIRAGSQELEHDVCAIWRKCSAEATAKAEEGRASAGLAKRLSASTWLSRSLPPVDRLLGDFLTKTTRAFLVGRTGLGKTMLGLGIAMGIAFGTGFLHWRSDRPGRVLFIDGEMPAELLIQRIRDAARRIGREDMLGNLLLFSTEDAEDIAERFPMLGMFEPLNTDPGQEFIKRLCTILQPDVVIFDNVQALLAGVQKEEETWIPVLPLVQWLTKQHIGQLWFDHTGHAAEHQYGTAVKSWRFDAVGLMTPLDEGDREAHETAFRLSFEPPGKARRRTPENWEEFEPHIIRLRDDVWTSEPAEKRNTAGGKLGKVPPSRRVFSEALVSSVGAHGNGSAGVTLALWEAACIRRGLIEPAPEKETAAQRRIRLRDFRKAKSDLIAAGWITVEGDLVVDLRGRWA